MKVKKFFAILLSLCLLCCMTVQATAEGKNRAEEKTLLSSLQPEECVEQLLTLGVAIPQELNGINIQKVVAAFESDPDLHLVVNYTVASDFLKAVRHAVNLYHGWTDEHGSASLTRYTLQYSTLHSWNPSTMPNYNCYAYALGRSSACDPGDFSGQSYNHLADISTVANVVKADLKGQLRYSCVKKQTSRPSSTSGWTNAIAVRKDTTLDVGFNDYHFAKLSSSNWYHKPGRTAVLKFKNAPTNTVSWTNEAYNGSYHAPSIWYESSIVYLLYKTNHGSTVYTWTGNHYHSGAQHYYEYGNKCQSCDEFVSTTWTSTPCSGPPCHTPWSVNPAPQTS